MAKYRKKPVVIEAVQWTGENDAEIIDFKNGNTDIKIEISDTAWEAGAGIPCIVGITISTLEGEMKATKGDYIIKGVNGEYYPCKPDIFEKSYEGDEKTIGTRNHVREDDWNTKSCSFCGYIKTSVEWECCPICGINYKEHFRVNELVQWHDIENGYPGAEYGTIDFLVNYNGIVETTFLVEFENGKRRFANENIMQHKHGKKVTHWSLLPDAPIVPEEE